MSLVRRSSGVCLGVILALLAGVPGCAGGLGGWRRVEPVPARFPPRQQVQVWHGGGLAVWHGVQLESDSLSGIPYQRPIDCAGCRVSLPAAAVDSVRWGDLERPGMLLGAAPFVAMAVAALAIRLSWGSD